MRKSSCAVLATAVVLAVPAAASAATVSASDSANAYTVSYDAGAGIANATTVTGTPASITIREGAGDPISLSGGASGCTLSSDATSVTCAKPGGGPVTAVGVDGDDGDDRLTDATTGFATAASFLSPSIGIFGGDGNDTVTGGPAAEVLAGGPGQDVLDGGGGDDAFNVGFAGSGDTSTDPDRISGGAGNDFAGIITVGTVYDGGPGDDAVLTSGTDPATYPPVTIKLDGPTPTTGNGVAGQNLQLANVEIAYGGFGDDTLTGSGAAETFIGLGGRDTIDAGGNSDLVYGDAGNDLYSSLITGGLGPVFPLPLPQFPPDGSNTITTRDGTIDRVDCGPGGAILTADDVDVLDNCPAAGAGTTLFPVPAPVATTTNVPVPVPTPVLVTDRVKAIIGAFKAAKTVKGKAIRRTGRFSVAFTPNEGTFATVALVATARKATIAKAGDLQLASRSFVAPATKRQTVRLTIPKSLRKLLKGKRRFTAVVSLVDGGGNRTTRTQTVRVKG